MQRAGRIVLLNGPSSSGKSCIGRAMLPLLDDPWFLVPVDSISALRSRVHRSALDEGGVEKMLRRTRLGYHRSVAALASVGNNVIMDYPLSEAWRLTDLLQVLQGYDVTLVHVRCGSEELLRRERAREDRPIGLAASQQVFEHGDCDISVDTTASTSTQCAGTIVGRLDALGHPKAFDRLRQRAY